MKMVRGSIPAHHTFAAWVCAAEPALAAAGSRVQVSAANSLQAARHALLVHIQVMCCERNDKGFRSDLVWQNIFSKNKQPQILFNAVAALFFGCLKRRIFF
jgi:hypothetical protein